MPPLPHVPEKGGFLHGVKFIVEVLWWFFTAAWLLFTRLPKWARMLLTLWIALALFSSLRCSRSADAPTNPPPTRTGQGPGRGSGDGQKKFRQAVERAVQSSREGENPLLQVQLLSVADSTMKWTETFPTKAADDTAVAEKIATQVLALVPRKEPRRPK
jgi:hypothetical protein